MPKPAQKAKALSGKGSVVSYAHESTKFYFHELIAGTKNYQYQLISDAETHDEALEKCIDPYVALRQREKLFVSRAITTFPNHVVVYQDIDKRNIRIKTAEVVTALVKVEQGGYNYNMNYRQHKFYSKMLIDALKNPKVAVPELLDAIGMIVA